jgi:catechol 2,3-dioxygenase-like lactoylglutathione lyase family enzyme
MKLNHVALICRSEQSADDFYEAVLGLKKTKAFVLSSDLTHRIFGIEREYRVLVYGNDKFTAEIFVSERPAELGTGLEHICLEVKDREEFVERCKAKGVEVNRVPKGDAMLTFVKDYDGNLFEIKEL